MRPKKSIDLDTDADDGEDFYSIDEASDHDHSTQNHSTEMGWLVSYADMMTLLFGLFVILYTIAHDKSKNVDTIMEEISAKYFNATPSVGPSTKDKRESKDKDSVDDDSDENVDANAKTSPIETPTDELSQSKSLEVQTTQLKAALEKEKRGSDKKANQLAEVSKKLASERLAVAALKKELEENLRSSGMKESEVEGLKKAIDTQAREKQGLQDEIDQLRKGQSSSPMQSYMMVILTWETEKHDIDLQVLDPHSKTFNFKARKIAGEPGEFALDSRFGPGMEMWKSANFLPGTYHAKVSLYNKNGNKNPAQAHLTVVTNRSTYKSEAIVLPQQGDEGDITFSVESDGTVKFGN